MDARSKETHALLTVLLVVAFATTGCGPGVVRSPDRIVEKAIEAQGRLKTVRVKVDLSVRMMNVPSTSGRASVSYRGEGFYESPDKSMLKLESGAGETEVITIGDKSYVKLPGRTAWSRRSAAEAPGGGTSPSDVRGYLKCTEGLRLVDTRGDTYHLEFKLDMGRYLRAAPVQGVEPSVFRGRKAAMEVWVLKDSFRVERASMEFKGDLSDVGMGRLEVSARIDFSEFNEPVTIEAPL